MEPVVGYAVTRYALIPNWPGRFAAAWSRPASSFTS